MWTSNWPWSAGFLGVRCGSSELFSEIGGYFSFDRDDLTRKYKRLNGVLKTAFSSYVSKYLLQQLLMEQESTVSRQISSLSSALPLRRFLNRIARSSGL